MTPLTREIISRATMLLIAALLLVGAWKIGKAAAWQRQEEAAWRETHPRASGSLQRETRISPLLWVIAAALGLGGLYMLKLAATSHRNIDRNPPKPATLWENPEPPTWGPPYL